MKIASIDIGSNAARILVVDVIASKHRTIEYRNINFVRLPLRLGFDVFETGEISKFKEQKIITAMQTFQNIIDFYDVKFLKACATSAFREARNGHEVTQAVKQQVGIEIKIISGDEEALLMNETHIAENLDREHGYLYVNVGGGSTDLIFFVDGKLAYKKSIDIGTIRILKNLVTESQWENMKTEIKANIKSNLPIIAIGSGGNINKVFSLSKKKEGKPISLDLLEQYLKEFMSVTAEERIRIYKFREDRADVIVPALQIYTRLMRWAGSHEMFVPKIGLVDGLVHALYQEIITSL